MYTSVLTLMPCLPPTEVKVSGARQAIQWENEDTHNVFAPPAGENQQLTHKRACIHPQVPTHRPDLSDCGGGATVVPHVVEAKATQADAEGIAGGHKKIGAPDVPMANAGGRGVQMAHAVARLVKYRQHKHHGEGLRRGAQQARVFN